MVNRACRFLHLAQHQHRHQCRFNANLMQSLVIVLAGAALWVMAMPIAEVKASWVLEHSAFAIQAIARQTAGIVSRLVVKRLTVVTISPPLTKSSPPPQNPVVGSNLFSYLA